MFQHVTVLVSFIFAIALTHVFSSASALILNRERVRFSALLTVSMVNAALGVIINWLALWQLENIKHWTLGEVLLQLGWVIPNYFSCSLVAISCSETGALDMGAYFERQRRVIFSATLALAVMAGLATYADRNTFQDGSLTSGSRQSWLGWLSAFLQCWLVGQSRVGCNGSASAGCWSRTPGILSFTRLAPSNIP
jgi:hypothetical protein